MYRKTENSWDYSASYGTGKAQGTDQRQGDKYECRYVDIATSKWCGDRQDKHASHWLAPTTETNQQNPIPLTYESMQKGARLFQENCATCHGKNADGNGVAGLNFKIQPANLRAMARTHKDGEFAYKIREGRGDMPSWKLVLIDTDIWNLVNYIKTLVVIANVPLANTSRSVARFF